MFKILSLFFILAGLSLVGYGGYQFMNTELSQADSLDVANKVLANTPKKVEPTEANNKASNFKPEMGEVVGILSIPSISAELPIVEGTDEDDLEKGVGHYKGTAYPLQKDQIVLSGHRDTVFRRMEDVKIGDKFIVKLHYGEFIYMVTKTEIVEADDRTVIQSTAPNEVLTVTTCYPFSFVGDAPQRYIITALPIDK